MSISRPTLLCRSWLFAPGAEAQALQDAATCGADVIIQELEDFTPRARRADARGLAADLYPYWRAKRVKAAVRINPFDDDGEIDLAAVMRGAPDIVALPKCDDPDKIRALDAAVTEHERDLGLVAGQTELLPNLESALAVRSAYEIANASPRVTAMLLASEDLAADLGADRQPDNAELQPARGAFFMACAAARVLAVDYPHTWAEGLKSDLTSAVRLGFRAKSCVRPEDAAIINEALTPGAKDIETAQKVVTAFEAAAKEGRVNISVDGILVELPRYNSAKRLLERAAALSQRQP